MINQSTTIEHHLYIQVHTILTDWRTDYLDQNLGGSVGRTLFTQEIQLEIFSRSQQNENQSAGQDNSQRTNQRPPPTWSVALHLHLNSTNTCSSLRHCPQDPIDILPGLWQDAFSTKTVQHSLPIPAIINTSCGTSYPKVAALYTKINNDNGN